MPPVGFEPTISAGKRPQTYASDRAATGTGCQVYYLTFMYSSTCFGHHAHHQELNNCGSNLWFYRWSVVVAVVGRGRADWPDHDQQHCYRHAPTVIPEAATAVVELLMMGVMPETC